MPSPPEYPVTPDGRYFVVRGRLWRRSNPHLSGAERAALVRDLMDARRAVAAARRRNDEAAETHTHAAVDKAKVALGERGPVWWEDGAPDLNRRLARNTLYADWYVGLATAPAAGELSSPQELETHRMTEKKGHGSTAAKKANAKAAHEGQKNPRKSSAAQSELGKKGGKTAAKK